MDFLELIQFVAQQIGEAFHWFAEFQIGDFNLLGFLIVYVVIDVLVSIFIIKLDNGISIGGGSGFHYTYDETLRINREKKVENERLKNVSVGNPYSNSYSRRYYYE